MTPIETPRVGESTVRYGHHRASLQLNRHDIRALICIVIVPLMVALPSLLGWVLADPMIYTGEMANGRMPGWLPGVAYIDPNVGFNTHALGYRAALDWIHGNVPWWNPYSGVGLPLAAEFHPAAFFPLTILLLLGPKGLVLRHVLLQILAGAGTYALLRQLGLRPLSATTGALLYAFNGTFAWFDHAPAHPVAFLPWMLLGIERARARAAAGAGGGWRLFGVAMAMNLLAGFPETSYINGLFALAWASLRWFDCPPGRRSSYSMRILIGGTAGVALCAPQILAFFEFLPHAALASHVGAFAHISLPDSAALPNLLMPYVFGPLFGLRVDGIPLENVFGAIGGYVTIVIVFLGVYGAFARADRLAWLLLAWTLLALAKCYGVEPFVTVWNLLPGIPETAFHRYSPPSWELALIVLVSFCIDELQSRPLHRTALVMSLIVLFVALVACGIELRNSIAPLAANASLRGWATISAAWAAFTVLGCSILLLATRAGRRRIALSILLVADAIVMYTVPVLSNPRAGTVDLSAISFLREHLGLQRFYSLGPIQPNYAAYFGIASINHNYLPVSQRWVDWIHARLDQEADAVNFNGDFARPAGKPSQAAELRRNLAAYEQAGVKYVVAPGGDNPFVESIPSQSAPNGNRPVQVKPGQSVTGSLPSALVKRGVTIAGVGVLLANYGGKSNGKLRVTLCSGSTCSSGATSLIGSNDNAVLDVILDAPLNVASGSTIQYTVAYDGGTEPAALWTYPVRGDTQAQGFIGPAGPDTDFGLKLHLRLESASATPVPSLAYSDALMRIYELPEPKPYFESLEGLCRLEVTDRTTLAADCQAPATLIRRELFFPGWSATASGNEIAISEHEDLFQAVNLPAGRSELRFRYAPPHIIWAWLAAWLSLAAFIGQSLTRRFHFDPTATANLNAR